MQRLSAQQYAQTLFEVLQDTLSQDHDKVLDNFIEAIILNGDQNLAGEILLNYAKIAKTNQSGTSSSQTVIQELNKLVNSQRLDKSTSGVLLKIDPADIK
jgi:F0F1-type ATP synthase delta subunit